MVEFSENGEFQFEKANDFILDMTDGYLSNLPGVTYHPDGNNPLGSLLRGDTVDKEEVDEVGSRLLKSFSWVHNIFLDYDESEDNLDYVLERAGRKTARISKLADKYANYNDDFRKNYYDDVLNFVEALNKHS